jgi:hypothetical protein
VPRVGASSPFQQHQAPCRDADDRRARACDALDLQTGAKGRVYCSLKSSDPQNIFVWAVRIKQIFISEVNRNSTSSLLQVKKFNFNSVSKVPFWNNTD